MAFELFFQKNQIKSKLLIQVCVFLCFLIYFNSTQSCPVFSFQTIDSHTYYKIMSLGQHFWGGKFATENAILPFDSGPQSRVLLILVFFLWFIAKKRCFLLIHPCFWWNLHFLFWPFDNACFDTSLLKISAKFIKVDFCLESKRFRFTKMRCFVNQSMNQYMNQKLLAQC